MELHVMNVNEALQDGLQWLKVDGVREESRNGPVIVSPEPVMTTYRFPMERLLFSPKRDANPFFHLFEALWMLAGRNDLEWPLYFNSKFGAFSDDGVHVHGAYGHRWRQQFNGIGAPVDQLKVLGDELRKNPTSRRCVLQMWNGWFDLHLAVGDKLGRDVPCNTHVYFEARDGLLNQTVLCRSNDIIWGAYGANAVHFSILLEYMAARAGLEVGVYRQFSNNYHLYPALYQKNGQSVELAMEELALDAGSHDYYEQNAVETSPIINVEVGEWDADLRLFSSMLMHLIRNDEFTGTHLFNDQFWNGCAVPMMLAWHTRKLKRGTGLEELSTMFGYPDWELACRQWIERREARKLTTGCGDCGKEVCTCHRVL